MRPQSTGGVYVNFLGDEGDERVRAAYGDAKYERVVGAATPPSVRWGRRSRTPASQERGEEFGCSPAHEMRQRAVWLHRFLARAGTPGPPARCVVPSAAPAMHRKSLETLEFPKVLAQVAGEAGFSIGKERVLALEPTA